MKKVKMKLVYGLAISSLFLAISCSKDQNSSPVTIPYGYVFTETNSVNDNELLQYERAENGSLVLKTNISTGGIGTGSGLGSQGALSLSSDKKFLFAVNAGNKSISSFKISEQGEISLVGKYSTVGTRPISISQRGSLVYVLTSEGAMGAGAIEGFNFDPSTGVLSTINNSLTALPNNSNGSQIAFVYDNVVAITERTTNVISTYLLNGQNIPSNRQTISADATGPYGFAVGNNGNIYVTEASPSSSVSSYKVSTNGQISLIKTLSNNQGGACWALLNLDESIVYSTNAGASSISSFNISPTGELTATQIAYTMGAGSGPADAGISKDGKYIYVLANGEDKIYGYMVVGNTLTLINNATMFVPGAAFGLAAY